MTSKEYIENQLKGFSKKFENYQFTYWYNDNYDDHFVEVIPEIFHENTNFVDFEFDLIKDFYLHFPTESLAFISPEQRNMISGLEKIKVFSSIINEWYKYVGLKDDCEVDDILYPDYSLAA